MNDGKRRYFPINLSCSVEGKTHLSIAFITGGKLENIGYIDLSMYMYSDVYKEKSHRTRFKSNKSFYLTRI